MVLEGLERLHVGRRPVVTGEPRPEPEIVAPPEEPADSSLKTSLIRAWRLLAVPLVIGVVLRLVLAPYTSWSHDVSSWWWTAIGGAQHVRMYHRLGFPYPPVWGELLQGLGWTLQEIGIRPTTFGATNLHLEPLNFYDQYSIIITGPLFNLLFKIVLMAFDLGTGLLLYALTLRLSQDEHRARLAFVLWFLNPLVLFETGVFGAFDVIVGFTVLCAVYFFLDQRYFWSGAAIMIAVLTKASPVLLIPLFLVLLLDHRTTTKDQRWRHLGAYLGGGAATTAVVILPLLATNQLGAGIHAVFARTEETTSFGGLSMFGLTAFRGAQSASHTLMNFSGLGDVVLLAQLLASVGLGFLAASVARRNIAFAVIGTVGFTMALIFLLGPVSNPQYLLWFLPEIVLLVAIWRRGAWALGLFTVAGLAYLLTLASPAALLFPLAQFTGLVKMSDLVRAIHQWDGLGAAPWSSGGSGVNFVGPLAFLVVVGVVLIAHTVLWAHPPRRNRSIVPTSRGTAAQGASLFIAAVLAVSLISEVAVAVTPSGAGVALRTRATATGVDVRAAVTPGPSLGRLRLAAFPVSTAVLPDRVDVYGDPRFPVSGTTVGTVAGVWDQLHGLLPLRGYHGALDHVNAEQLARQLRDLASAPRTAIVFTSGIFPDTVFTATKDLVTPWLHAGGTLIWGGTRIGYYTGAEGERNNLDHYPGSLLDAGVARFLNPLLIGNMLPPSTAANVATPDARAMGLIWRFNDAGVIVLPVTPGISSQGWIGRTNYQSSVTNVADGAGHLVIFSSQIANEHLIAPDITLFILSGLANASGPITARSVPTSVTDHGGIVRWPAAVGAPTGPVRVVAFDPTIEGLVFSRTTAGPSAPTPPSAPSAPSAPTTTSS